MAQSRRVFQGIVTGVESSRATENSLNFRLTRIAIECGEPVSVMIHWLNEYDFAMSV